MPSLSPAVSQRVEPSFTDVAQRERRRGRSARKLFTRCFRVRINGPVKNTHSKTALLVLKANALPITLKDAFRVLAQHRVKTTKIKSIPIQSLSLNVELLISYKGENCVLRFNMKPQENNYGYNYTAGQICISETGYSLYSDMAKVLDKPQQRVENAQRLLDIMSAEMHVYDEGNAYKALFHDCIPDVQKALRSLLVIACVAESCPPLKDKATSGRGPGAIKLFRASLHRIARGDSTFNAEFGNRDSRFFYARKGGTGLARQVIKDGELPEENSVGYLSDASDEEDLVEWLRAMKSLTLNP